MFQFNLDKRPGKRLCIDPITGAAAISAGANLVGSLFNKKSSDSAQKMQYKMFQEGNKFNREEREASQAFNAEQSEIARQYGTKEREAQQSWQERMIQQQQIYDSAEQQVARLRKAGINTAMMNGTTGAGGSAAPTGVPAGQTAEAQAGMASSASAPHVQPSLFDFNSLNDSIRNLSQSLLNNAQEKKIDAERKEIEMMMQGKYDYQQAVINYTKVKTNWTEEDAKRVSATTKKLAEETNNLAEATKNLIEQREEIKARTDISRVQKKILDKQLQYFDSDKAWEYYLNKCKANNLNANTALTQAQFKTEAEKLRSFMLDNDKKEVLLNLKDENGQPLYVTIEKAEGQMRVDIANAKGAVEGSETAQWIDFANNQLNSLLGSVATFFNVTDRFIPSERNSSSTTTLYNGNGTAVRTRTTNTKSTKKRKIRRK